MLPELLVIVPQALGIPWMPRYDSVHVPDEKGCGACLFNDLVRACPGWIQSPGLWVDLLHDPVPQLEVLGFDLGILETQYPLLIL